MDMLVGNTGFVGSNLAIQHQFDKLYCSKNIFDSFELSPELCIYAGVRAEKFLSNSNFTLDREHIDNAIDNIKHINPKKLVLISTIDVFKNPNKVDETTQIDTISLQPYGLNRYYLEQWVSNNIKDYHIIRLPALFGENIKKNFIYDLIHIIPSMLNEQKFFELNLKNKIISEYFLKQENGFYKCKSTTQIQKEKLISVLNELEFSALNFTDSRARFSFYNLSYLWKHISIIIQNNIQLSHMATEPLTAEDIYLAVQNNEQFKNEIIKEIPDYDFKTIYSDLFGGKNGYIFDKETILADIIDFIGEQKR